MNELTFTVDFPPSINHSHREIRTGKRSMRIAKPETIAYKDAVALIARNAAQLVAWTPSERLAIEVALYMPRRGLDVDNRHKVLQDAVADGLGINDKLFRSVHIYDAGLDRKQPRAVVKIRAL